MRHKSSLTSIGRIAGLALTLILSGGIATSQESSIVQSQVKPQTQVQRLPSPTTLPSWIKLVDAQSQVGPSQPIPFSFEFVEPTSAAGLNSEERTRAMPPVLRGPSSHTPQLAPTVRRLPNQNLVQSPTPLQQSSPGISRPDTDGQRQQGLQATPPTQRKSNPEVQRLPQQPTPAVEEAKPPKKTGATSQPQSQAQPPANSNSLLTSDPKLPPPPTVIPSNDESTNQPSMTESKSTEPETIQAEVSDEFDLNAPSIQPPSALPPATPIVEPNEIMKAIQQQVDIQQQQIDTLQDMMRATSDRIGGNGNPGSRGDTAAAITSTQFATIAAQQRLSMQRDTQVAREFDNIRERIDAIQRNGIPLPAPAREHFMPTRFNESPIAHYGQLATNYDDFSDADSNFSTPVYFGRFLGLLNEKLLLDVNTVISDDDFELASAQLDWYATDNLTVSTGRLYAPIGFFNERLQSAWVWKSVDVPLMFNQVFPNRFAINGVSARGAFYPGMVPVKIEYAIFGGNGVALDDDNPDPGDLANFRAFSSPFKDNNNDKAVGGRIGISMPELGMIAGLSGMTNGAYDNNGQDGLDLWGFDFSLHRGNWDYRFEMIQVNQQAATGSIDRNGWYTQLAYRNLNSVHSFWNKVELLARVDSVDFDGIDLTQLDLGSIRRENQTVDRHRWTLQANYYVHPSLIVKAGYEILDEHGIDEISDNGFLAQVVFGF